MIAAARFATAQLRPTLATENDKKDQRLLEPVPGYRKFLVRKLLIEIDHTFVSQTFRDRLDFVLLADQFFR
jgi:hypothetical protein